MLTDIELHDYRCLVGQLAGLIAERCRHQSHGMAAGRFECQSGFRLIRKSRLDRTKRVAAAQW